MSEETFEMPYIKEEELIIPNDADPKYKYWAGGQSVSKTLEELGAGLDVKKRYCTVKEDATE